MTFRAPNKIPKAISPFRKRLRSSMEYVENVVKAPKRPTFKINLISSDTSIEELCIVANDIPITSPPIRLTASVP